MDAIPTANATNATNATMAGASAQASPAASGVNKATDATGLPAFAQIVQGFLNLTTTSSGPQGVGSSRAAPLPKTMGPAASTPRPGRDGPLADVSSAAMAVSLALLPNLLLPPPPLSLDAPNAANAALTANPVIGGTQAETPTTGSAMAGNAGTPGAATASSDAKNGGPTSQDIAAALAQQITAPLSNGPSVPALLTAALAKSANAPAATASTAVASEGAPASTQPAGAAARAPIASPQTKASVVQTTVLAPVGEAAQPVAPLLPQVLQLPKGAAEAPSSTSGTLNTPAASALHSPPAQSGTLTHAALQFAAAGPAVPTAPLIASKGLPPVVDAAKTTAPVPAWSSSPDRAASQDAGSDHKEPAHTDAQTSADASSATPAVHDATSFSASLAAANVKQDASLPPSTAPAVTTSAPAATSDRAASSSGGTPPATPPAPSSLPSFPGTEAAASRFVNSAQLVQAASHSEMRIAMDTDKLGAIELRAHIVGDEVGAAIMVEKRDAHTLLAVELPALQQALSDKQLRIEQVTLSHGSFSSTAGDAGASAKQDARDTSHAASHANLGAWSPNGPGGMPSMFANAAASEIFDSQGRLSVHA